MPHHVQVPGLSPKRRELASLENAYRLATTLAQESGENQIIIETGDVLQAHRVLRPSDVLPGGKWCGTRLRSVRAYVDMAR